MWGRWLSIVIDFIAFKWATCKNVDQMNSYIVKRTCLKCIRGIDAAIDRYTSKHVLFSIHGRQASSIVVCFILMEDITYEFTDFFFLFESSFVVGTLSWVTHQLTTTLVLQIN